MTEPRVCLQGRFLAAGLGFVFDDCGDVIVFLCRQVAELEPVGGRNQFDIVLGEVAHQQELFSEEAAVHLIGFNGEEAREAAYSLGV